MKSLDAEKEYREFLNDTEPQVQIAGLIYLAGDVLAEVDPTALRCMALDWADCLVSDGEWVEIDGEFYLASEARQAV